MLQIIQNCWCFLLNVQIPILYMYSSKKNHTDAKAKVVAADWGTELFLLNAALEIQRQNYSKKRIN